MLSRCLQLFGVVFHWVLAAERRVDTYIAAVNRGHGVIFQIPQAEEAVNMEATLSTQLSELIVIDERCGRRRTECPRYCDSLDFTEILCEIDCQHPSITSPQLACSNRRYDYTLSRDAESLNQNWTNRLSYSKRLIGDLRRDLITIQNWKGQDNQTAAMRMEFVSAKWFDSRVLRVSSAVLGLQPGPNAAIPQILKHLGAQDLILTVSAHQPNSPIRHLLSPMIELYLNLGVQDRARCTNREFRWFPTEDNFMLKVPKVNFMGVEFANVELIFDLAEEVFVVSSAAARRLESLGVMTPFFRLGFANIYMYNCTDDPPIQFLDADNEVMLEFRQNSLTYSIGVEMPSWKCPSVTVLDNGDPDTWPRYAEVWHVGTFFLRTHCLAYDYARNWIGFGEARRWPHPFVRRDMWTEPPPLPSIMDSGNNQQKPNMEGRDGS